MLGMLGRYRGGRGGRRWHGHRGGGRFYRGPDFGPYGYVEYVDPIVIQAPERPRLIPRGPNEVIPCAGLVSIGKGLDQCSDGSIIYDVKLYEERSGVLVKRGSLRALEGITYSTNDPTAGEDAPVSIELNPPYALSTWYAANPLLTLGGLLATGFVIGWVTKGRRNGSGDLAGTPEEHRAEYNRLRSRFVKTRRGSQEERDLMVRMEQEEKWFTHLPGHAPHTY